MSNAASCCLCPRLCGVNRAAGEKGVCAMGALPVVARAAPHFGEEPCISGTRGSGTVFFSGCSLHCVYCQNRPISFENTGKEISVEQLAGIFRRLEDKGVHNLNLVTASHFADSVAKALALAKPHIPVVWNSSGYERVETLQMLEGLVDVYLPDLKYADPNRRYPYFNAPEYPEAAKAAIMEMYRQTGPYKTDSDGLLLRGVLIRHLLLPGGLEDALDVMDFVSGNFPRGSVIFSLMGQFVPLADKSVFPELARTVGEAEYSRALEYARLSGLEAGYSQELSAATDEMIPDFDLTGL